MLLHNSQLRNGMFLMVTAIAVQAASAVDIVVDDSRGALVKKRGTDEYVDLAAGTVLSTCDTICLPGNFSEITWRRVGECPNSGKVVGTGLSKIKYLHVGTDIGAGPGNLPPGGYFDLVLEQGAEESSATIIEGESCEGNGHCGMNSAMAAAVAIDPTPPGESTVYSGNYGISGDGQEYAQFVNYPTNHIPIVSTPYFGPFRDRLIQVPPGQMITWYPDGTFALDPAPPCTGLEELTVTACRPRTCGNQFKAKLSNALPGAPATFTLDGRVFARKTVNDRGKAVGKFCGSVQGVHEVGAAECGAVEKAECR